MRINLFKIITSAICLKIIIFHMHSICRRRKIYALILHEKAAGTSNEEYCSNYVLRADKSPVGNTRKL